VREIEPTEITNVLSHSRYNREYEDLAMTTAEKLIQKGKIEGKIEGKVETKIEIAENMLLKGVSLEFVLSVTGLTEQDLKDHGLL
ncbi:Rpn family recombination-promoting nuclease/putative transposase, partial [Leptospira interrogans]|uniref:Rpn family recombination-promoting nuclease/putative transposase n=1 Tax=Leptospira interrogans TaxID=173 RepID=UPI000A472F27